MKIPAIATNTKTFLKINQKSQYNSDYYQTHKKQYLKSQIEKLTNEKDFFVKNVLIKNPDNPQEKLKARLIYFGY